MRFLETDIADAVVVVPALHTDERGTFARVFCTDEFSEHGLETSVAQANLATTRHAGTVRGLHYQLPPAAEAKLLRCLRGAVFDVVVDVRPQSPTFGRWTGVKLTADDGQALYVPTGCAHGYQALTDDATVLYHVSAPYTPKLERGVHHADPAFGIDWPLAPRHISDKDRRLPVLEAAELPELVPQRRPLP